MCGRYASFRDAQDLADTFAIADAAIAEDARERPPSWNLAPTDPVRVVVERAARDHPAPDPVRSLRLARWGLVPGWAKDPSVGARMINARAEGLAGRPAFRQALTGRRCLVPADGYYEWQRPAEGSPRGTPRQPFWIHAADGAVLALAGLYEFWRDPTRDPEDPERWLVTTTIITTTPTPGLAHIHDRRPVALTPQHWSAWLDPSRTGDDDALALLATPPPHLDARPVGTAVNRVGNDGPELLAPVA